jgi:two-component system response regulator (stage 0 sporulation protein F)
MNEDRTILIVEDNADMHLLLSNIFRDAGYKTSSVYNGYDALRIYNKTHPEFIVLDLRLPGKNGLEIIREIRQNNKDVKIILITAYGDHRTEKKIMDMGAYAYFTKPFSNCDLLNTINHANEERFVEAQ